MANKVWAELHLAENSRWYVTDISLSKKAALRHMGCDPEDGVLYQEREVAPHDDPRRYVILVTTWRDAIDNPPASLLAVPKGLSEQEEGWFEEDELFTYDDGRAAVEAFNHAARFEFQEADDDDFEEHEWAVLVELGAVVGRRYIGEIGPNGMGWRRFELLQPTRVVQHAVTTTSAEPRH